MTARFTFDNPMILRQLCLFLSLVTACTCAAEPFGAPHHSWQGIPGLERTAKGRVFSSWFTGGPMEPSPENIVLLCYSNDQAKTFTPPQIMAEPKNGTRCFDPTLWIDPKGRLWYIFNRGNKDTALHDVHARICDDPDATPPVFGPEFRVGYEGPYAFRMNKPTVLSTGEWIMPVTHAIGVRDTFAFIQQQAFVPGVSVIGGDLSGEVAACLASEAVMIHEQKIAGGETADEEAGAGIGDGAGFGLGPSKAFV